MKTYDIIVIGGGAGAKIISPAAKLGYKVAAIEKETMGGTCLNRGCIPSKMLIYPADVAELIREAGKFDITLAPGFEVDFEKLTTRISNTVDAKAAQIPPAYEKNPNIDYYHHEARFISDKVVAVNGEKLTAEKIFIVVGGRPHIPDIPGLLGTPFMTSREALRATQLPKRLIVIGGSYIATELGHAYGALGSAVHFVVRSQLLRHEDPDIASMFTEAFSKRHQVHQGFVPTRVSYEKGVFQLQCRNQQGSEQVMEAEALLIATGFIPNTDSLGIDNTGIRLDSKGYIKVDDYLMTSVPGVYAFGDVIGRYQFRHSANFEGEYLMRVLFEEKSREAIDYGAVPHAVFTHPQIAGVGKTEQELQQEGIPYVAGINHYQDSAMGMARLPEYGLVKVLFHADTGKLLGAHLLGDEASNMVHLFILGMSMGATVDDLLKMIYVHPALPEICRNACRKAKKAILDYKKKHAALAGGKAATSGSLEW